MTNIDLKEERKNVKNNYEIIKLIGYDINGELFLVKPRDNDNEENELYIMEKIEVEHDKEKYIKNKLETLSKIESKYIIKINDYFFGNENGKNLAFIIMEYFEKRNLYEIIYDTNYLNERTIWNIFIQITLGLKVLNENGIFYQYISPKNIFLNKNNKIKLGGFDIILENDEDNYIINNEYLSSYIAPEILYSFPYSKEKCNSWSLGCVLYELIFKKRAFDYEERQKYILKNRFEIPDDCERDFKTVIQKLLCKDFNRLTISDLVFEVTFKRKVIELNLFDEIIKGSIQCKYIFIFIIIKYIL